MSEVTIKSNGHARELQYYAQLPEDVQAQFDYVEEDDQYTTRFFEYRGSWYDINEFQVISYQSAQLRDPLAYNSFGLRVSDDNPIGKWTAAQAQSAFSAVLIKWGKDWDGQDDYDSVIVGYAHW